MSAKKHTPISDSGILDEFIGYSIDDGLTHLVTDDTDILVTAEPVRFITKETTATLTFPVSTTILGYN